MEKINMEKNSNNNVANPYVCPLSSQEPFSLSEEDKDIFQALQKASIEEHIRHLWEETEIEKINALEKSFLEAQIRRLSEPKFMENNSNNNVANTFVCPLSSQEEFNELEEFNFERIRQMSEEKFLETFFSAFTDSSKNFRPWTKKVLILQDLNKFSDVFIEYDTLPLYNLGAYFHIERAVINDQKVFLVYIWSTIPVETLFKGYIFDTKFFDLIDTFEDWFFYYKNRPKYYKFGNDLKKNLDYFISMTDKHFEQ